MQGPDACLNCGTALAGPFCSACGQGRVDVQAPLASLAREAVADGLSWDGRLLWTLRLLLTAPGALSEAWASGRRAPFVSPVRLYVMLGGALLLVTAAAGFVDESPDPVSDPDKVRRTTMQAAFLVGKWTRLLGLNALLLVVPLAGFVTYVLFKERRRFLAGHLVWALHVASAALAVLVTWKTARLVHLLFDPAAGPWASKGVVDVVFGVLLAGVAGYATVAARRFFQIDWGRAVTAGLLIALIPPIALLGTIVAVAMALTLG